MELIHIQKIDSFTDALKDYLIQFCLPISQCHGQAYNGISNMSDYLSIIGVKIQIEIPLAIFGLVMELTQLIQYSAKCTTLFEISKVNHFHVSNRHGGLFG